MQERVRAALDPAEIPGKTAEAEGVDGAVFEPRLVLQNPPDERVVRFPDDDEVAVREPLRVAGGEGFVEMAAFDVFSLRQYLQERMASGRRGDAFEGRPDFRRRVFRGGDCKRTLRCGEYGRTQNGGEQKF